MIFNIMALRGSKIGDNTPNPYLVTEEESGHVNAAFFAGGDVLPLINLIMSKIDRRFKPVFEHLSERIQKLENEVAELKRVAIYHSAVHAVDQPALAKRDDWDSQDFPPDVEDSSQEVSKKDIKF
jgi:hypothetical protein